MTEQELLEILKSTFGHRTELGSFHQPDEPKAVGPAPRLSPSVEVAEWNRPDPMEQGTPKLWVPVHYGSRHYLKRKHSSKLEETPTMVPAEENAESDNVTLLEFEYPSRNAQEGT